MANPCQNPNKGQSCMQTQECLESRRRMRLMLQDLGSCQLPQCERRKSALQKLTAKITNVCSEHQRKHVQ